MRAYPTIFNPRQFVIAAAIAIAAAPGAAHARAAALRAPTIVALEEESIAGADLTPTPTETPTPDANGNLPPTPVATPSETPTEGPIFAEPSAIPTATGDAAPLDAGSITPTLRISDAPLDSVIAAQASPARAASLRVTEQARRQLERDHPDEAIRTLSRAVGIDPGNPYAYFFLGRAYIAKKDDEQAMSFLKRAEIGFGSGNPTWLGETLAYEGLTYEESGHMDAAAAAYQQAIAADPGNLMARVGYTRVAPEVTPQAPAAPPGAPADSAIAPPPPADAAPAPPPAASPPAPPPPRESAPPVD
ncbi:MAG TPA: tetratricopeptide repeat protein [Candidatus Binataceae bacterium]|nr:tetratricopeptide repeat protein [Candidatus Binataceae bacterium]